MTLIISIIACHRKENVGFRMLIARTNYREIIIFLDLETVECVEPYEVLGR
jgi:hypothetical protein